MYRSLPWICRSQGLFNCVVRGLPTKRSGSTTLPSTAALVLIPGHDCAWLPVAGDRCHAAFYEVDLTQHVVFGVGHVQRIPLERHPLRVIERGGRKLAVGRTEGARADDVDQGAVEFRDHDTVVIAIGDKQPLVRLVGQELAGEPQGRVGRAIRGQIEPQRRLVERPLFAVIGNGLLQDGVANSAALNSPLRAYTAFPSGSIRMAVGQLCTP